MYEKLDDLVAAGDLPPCYWQHPAVPERKHDEPLPIPICIFVDAVPYSLTDSILGWWGINLLNQRRYLFCVARKRRTCTCGCRGWCSYWGMSQLTRWSLDALSCGAWPSARHDESAWLESDRGRSMKSGARMNFKAACLYVKADWAEYAHTMGLPTWHDHNRPCFGCNAHGTDMYVTTGNTPEQLRWVANDESHWDTACSLCEINVDIASDAVRDELAKALHYDKRQAGSRGRSLVKYFLICFYANTIGWSPR